MTNIVQQRTVWFYDDALVAIQRADGVIFVSFRRLCENLEIDRRGQARRVERHAVLSKGFAVLDVQTEGGSQATHCLRLDLLPLWLSGIQVSRVKEELRDKLTRYQEEAAAVLWDAFKPQILAKAPDSAPAEQSTEIESSIQELRRIAALGDAIAHMARQQIAFQQQQEHLSHRLDKAGKIVKGLQEDIATIQIRLGTIEETLHPSASITDEQAATVSSMVKALAEVLTRQAGKNQYQSVFGELYRRFGVSSYKLIRQDMYADVLSFLEDWRKTALTGSDDPAPDTA